MSQDVSARFMTERPRERQGSASSGKDGRRMLKVGHTIASAAGLRTKKKFHFEVTFCLQDLLNCTYITGVLFAKIRLKDGGSYADISRREEVDSHCVKWQQEFQFPCKMYASPNTAELEPCVCKVSVRKETKGGRSYKKLGFVKINLAEYAGAGVTQRKYLLESYNENKHKPDNSILKVRIALRQTSGDVLFKAPHAPVWELSEAEDEGIQADLQSMRSRTSSSFATSGARVSTASTLSGLSTGSSSSNLKPGGSLQDMRRRASLVKETDQGKSVSAGNLRGQNGDSGSSESDSTGQRESSESLPQVAEEKDQGSDKTEVVVSPEPAPSESSGEVSVMPKSLSPNSRERKLLKEFREEEEQGDVPNRSSSFGSSDLNVSGTSFLSLPGAKHMSHRRQVSLGAIPSSGSPLRVQHKRYQSMSISGNSSKSTLAQSSAYSTLSEKLVASSEVHETESICSQRSRISLLPSSRVEQSRVDVKSVVDELFQSHDLSHVDEEEGSEGLKIYVDKDRGTVTLAGTHLDRRYKNLKPIDLSNHSVRPKSKRKSNSSLNVASKEAQPVEDSASAKPQKSHSDYDTSTI